MVPGGPELLEHRGGVTAMSQVAMEAILMMVPGTAGDNAYGPEPRA